MLLFIGVPKCSRGAFMNALKLTQPRMLWLGQRLTRSAALPRTNSLPRKNMSAATCASYRAVHTPAGRTRTLSHTRSAFASSSSASSPTPAESAKAPPVQATTVPLEDVKRILKLAQSERWRLAGKAFCLFTFRLYDV